MSNVTFFVKTKSFVNDNRVHKEIGIIKGLNKNVNVVLACDDNFDSSSFSYPIKVIKIPGGAANKNVFIRILGGIYFSILSFIMARKKSSSVYWISDPILLPLVFLFNLVPGRVVWDQHELPPSWVFNSVLLKTLFSCAYKSCHLVIHTNKMRKEKLESWLKVKANQSIVMKNIPSRDDLTKEEAIGRVDGWLGDKKFIFLQNSLTEARCGAGIVKAAFSNGIKVVHAGNSVDLDYLRKAGISEVELEKNIFLCGNLNLNQINYLLKRCFLTTVFYKKSSLNQTYCEPNRVYQAMANNTYIISGNNPTLQDILSGYPNKIVVDSDGSNFEFEQLVSSLLSNKEVNSFNYTDFWDKYKNLLKDKLFTND